MRAPYRNLPAAGGSVPRPVLDVVIEGLPDTGLACLVDSGSLHNRFGMWVADLAGIDVAGAEVETLALAGITTRAYSRVVQLSLGAATWEAPVSFCEPWPWDFNLLGQEGFFRYFSVCFHAATLELDVELAGN